MADTTSEKLMAQFRAGMAPSRFEKREPKADATTRKVQRALYDAHEAGSALPRGEEGFNARVEQRAAKLKREGVRFPEDTARNQIIAEDQAWAEERHRAEVQDHLRRVNDSEQKAREWSERAVQPVAPGQHRDRTSEKLMAQFFGGKEAVRKIAEAEEKAKLRKEREQRRIASILAALDADEQTEAG